MKYFIITIDTEGDNLWNWKLGSAISTENACYLQRFQDLCEKHTFKPVWLTNYEMINDDRYVDFIRKVVQSNNGECGMHLHAWNTPPLADLPFDDSSGAPYLIEYSRDIMEQKINTMTCLIKEKLGITPVSHRAGRWAINEVYYELLEKYGYTVDCSVTPGINWSKARGQSPGFFGTDYSNSDSKPYFIKPNLLEVPVTVHHIHKLFWPEECNSREILKSCYYFAKGKKIWLRPNGKNLKELLTLTQISLDTENDYLMFMIHSSELMPGGSPTFSDKPSIEKLYSDLEILFNELSKQYIGITLSNYANRYIAHER